MKKLAVLFEALCAILIITACEYTNENVANLIIKSEKNTTSDGVSLGSSSVNTSADTEDEEYYVPEAYSEEADAILARLINSENWYYGEYSEFDDFRGESFNVECIEDGSRGEKVNHYFVDGADGMKYILVSVSGIFTDPYVYKFSDCTEEQKEEILKEIDVDRIGVISSIFDMTVDDTPTNPNELADYEEQTLPEEVKDEIYKIIECIHKGFSYQGKVYIRQVGTPVDRYWSSDTETDAFLVDEITGNVVHFSYSANYYQTSDADWAYGITENRIITKSDKKEWYYYKQVKETTDWIIDTAE